MFKLTLVKTNEKKQDIPAGIIPNVQKNKNKTSQKGSESNN